LEEFTKTFCHFDDHREEIVSPKGFSSIKKRFSSLIGVTDKKARVSIPIEISIDLIGSNKAYSRIIMPESDPLYFPNFKRRLSSFAIFMRNFSFSMHAESLDLNRIRHKSLQPNNLCFSDIMGLAGKKSNSSLRKRHSFHHFISKSLFDCGLNRSSLDSSTNLGVPEKNISILRRHSLCHPKSYNNVIGIKPFRSKQVSFRSEYTKLSGSS